MLYELRIRDNGEFTATFLLDPLSSIGAGLAGIEKVELLDIDQVQPGYLPAGTNQGRVEISFTAKVKFTALMRQRPFMPSPKYRVGQADTSSLGILPFPYLLGADDPVVKREIEKDLRIEGSVHLVEFDQYSDLKLGRVPGSSIMDVLLSR